MVSSTVAGRIVGQVRRHRPAGPQGHFQVAVHQTGDVVEVLVDYGPVVAEDAARWAMAACEALAPR